MFSISYTFLKAINIILTLVLLITIVTGFVHSNDLVNVETQLKEQVHHKQQIELIKNFQEMQIFEKNRNQLKDLGGIRSEYYFMLRDLKRQERRDPFFKKYKSKSYRRLIAKYGDEIEYYLYVQVKCLDRLLAAELTGEKITLECGTTTGIKGKGIVARFLEREILSIREEIRDVRRFK